MARRRASEEEESSEDEQVKTTPKPTVLSPNTKKTDDDSGSDEESSSESESEEEDTSKDETSEDEQVQATPKPTVLSPNTKKTDDDSESDDESSSESESESEPADSTVKPIASKPMEEKKGARSKPSVAAMPEKKSAAKRPRESETTAKDSKKRVKKRSGPEVPPPEADGDGGAASDEEQEKSKKSAGDDSKKLSQRLWSAGDEILILKGLIDQAAKRGGNPAATDTNALHDLIQKSLRIVVTKAQLYDKVRRLKKKYSNNAARKKYNPTKPHEQNVFELSKKIWGSGGCGRAVVSSSKANSATKSNGKATLATPAAPKEGSRKIEIGEKWSGSVRSSEMIGFAMKCLPEAVVKKGLDLVPASKKAKLDAMWNKLNIDELELFVRKNLLINEQVQLVLEKLKASDH